MFQRFTEKAANVIRLAEEEARSTGQNWVGTEQILKGMLREGTGIAAKTLEKLGVNLEDAAVEVEKIIGKGSGSVTREIPFTPRAKRLLEFSCDEAKLLGHSYVGTEHLLLGLCRESEGVGAQVIEIFGLKLAEVRQVVLEALGPARQLPPPGATDVEMETAAKYPEAPYPTETDLEQIVFKFSDNARLAQAMAQEETHRLRHHFVGAEHILHGLIVVEEGKAALALQEMGVDKLEFRSAVKAIVGRGNSFPQLTGEPGYTPRAKRILAASWVQAQKLGHNYIGTGHLLLGLLEEEDGVAVRALESMDLDLGRLKSRMISILNSG